MHEVDLGRVTKVRFRIFDIICNKLVLPNDRPCVSVQGTALGTYVVPVTGAEVPAELLSITVTDPTALALPVREKGTWSENALP